MKVAKVTQEKIGVEKFVLSAIHLLCKDERPRNGIHVVDSGLNGALHLYFGGSKHPADIIGELIKKGVVCGKLAKGGIIIYDPQDIEAFDHKKCFCDLNISVKKVEDKKMLGAIKG